jgi:hypothetical protein
MKDYAKTSADLQIYEVRIPINEYKNLMAESKYLHYE